MRRGEALVRVMDLSRGGIEGLVCRVRDWRPKDRDFDAPAMAILTGLERIGSYVMPGDNSKKAARQPETSLASPPLHDRRHTYASFDAGGGLGLPIIGKPLGHIQASTNDRCTHLDNDLPARWCNSGR